MRSIRRILVAIKDYEAKPTPALVKGAQLARALGAHLELFHGISNPLYVDGHRSFNVELSRVEHEVRSGILTRLETMAEKLRCDDIKLTVAAEWDFPAYEAIVRRAQQIQADLIVADQHAGRHRAAGLLHLTDWELLRLSPVPVLLVKTSGAYRRPVVLAALDPGHTFSKPAKLYVERMLAGSDLVIALVDGAGDRLVAFARVLTDFIYRAVVFDVIVASDHRGRGFGARLMDLLVARGQIKPEDKDGILAALKQREETMSTGIGFGIAIPHCSSDRLDKVVAAFGRSSKGIEFDALDNAPVKFVVLFVVPKNQFQTHLRTLASIAKFLNDRTVRDQLASADSADAILQVFRARAQS